MLPGKCMTHYHTVMQELMSGKLSVSGFAFTQLRATSRLIAPFLLGANSDSLCLDADFCKSVAVLMNELCTVVEATYPPCDSGHSTFSPMSIPDSLPLRTIFSSSDPRGNLFDLPSGSSQNTQIPEREFFEYGTFFPGLFIERSLRNYIADNANAGYGERDLCTKHAYLGGSEKRVLFIMTCAGCNMVLGFSVLNVNESPRALFELLFTRFRVAPESVIYDNACNASLYCLKREPKFFEDTHFCIDKMHIRDHATSSCSPAYHPSNNVDSYDDSASRRLNNQQVNSFIKNLSGQAKLMTVSNYLFSIRDFLAQLNEIVAKKNNLVLPVGCVFGIQHDLDDDIADDADIIAIEC